MADWAFAFDDLTLGYGARPVLRSLDGEIAMGALTAIVGPNGAGKSTVLKALAGVLSPLSGRIRRNVRREDIAWLPQSAEIDRAFPVNVFDFAATGLWRRIGPFGAVTRRRREAVEAALDAVGLADFAAREIGMLSGGQLQRVLFARLILQDAKVILLDEPFNAIDADTERDLMALIECWHAEGRTVLAALHDLDLVRRHFPTSLLLAGRIVAAGPSEACLSEANLDKARELAAAQSRGFSAGRHAA